MLKEQFLGQLSVELCCVGLEQGRMEKKCGFCGDTRPLVYCKADAASLCLACDVRIHAANALFRRHIRALLCQACGAKPASIRCLDHSNVVCQGCDRKLHGASVQHRKCVISSYTGCPSAKEFASLWGFGLKELSNNGGSASFGSAILDVANEGVHEASNVCSSSNTMDRKASSSNLPSWTKPKNQSKQLHKTALHQSLDMQRFQHHKTKNLSLIPDQIKAEELKIRAGELKVIKQHSEESQAFVNAELKQGDNKHPELQGPHFPPPVFHSDNMNLISNDDVHFHGDPFWPSNHPTQDNQLWYQTSLDLGFYEDINCYDGLSIPDFGPTFPDYEELFDGDNCQTQSMQSGIDSACSSIACDTSIAKSDFDHPTSTEALQPSSHCKDQPDNCFLSGGFTDDYSAPTKGASSSSSITFSSYSAEISTFKYPSSSVSSNATKRDLQRKFTEAGNGAHLESNAIKKNKKA